MNKLYKYILIGIGVISIFIAQANAGYINFNGLAGFSLEDDHNNSVFLDCNNPGEFYTELPSSITIQAEGEEREDPERGPYIAWNAITTVNCPTCPTCPTCPETPTCNYSGYILESEIDQNYCESRNLCTVCGDTTGEINTGVNWSSLFLNGIQINSNAIINISTDERLNVEIEYLNDTVDINITQNINTSYIEEIKNKEKLTPTNEDVEYIIQGLQVYIPYIFISLIIVYTLYLIKKFFRG